MATDPGQESPVRALLRMTPPRDEGARFLFPRIAVVDLPVVDQSVTAALSRQFFIRGDYLLIPFFRGFRPCRARVPRSRRHYQQRRGSLDRHLRGIQGLHS